MATTVNDKVMYLVLVAAIVAGLGATALGSGVVGEAYNYRETVSVWFRSVWVLQPRGDLMAEAPLYYQIHVLIGLALFALWPFTRLVHAFSAPIGYLFRPYIIYRSREELVLTRPRRRGGDGSASSASGQDCPSRSTLATRLLVEQVRAGVDFDARHDFRPCRHPPVRVDVCPFRRPAVGDLHRLCCLDRGEHDTNRHLPQRIRRRPS